MLIRVLFAIGDKRLQVDARSDGNLAGVGVAVRHLQVFGSQEGDTQAIGNVIGDEIAPQRQNNSVPDGAFHKDGNVGGAPADVQQDGAQVFFGGRQDRLAGGQRLQHQIINLNQRFLHAFYQVLNGGDGSRNDMAFNLQPVPRHADGIFDAFLPIHQIAA